MLEIGIGLTLISWLFIGYVYLGYPILLWALSRFKLQAVSRKSCSPFVTLIISAYNEETSIKNKLENSIALDYPKESLEIIVVSDASTDGTDSLVQSFESHGIILLRLPERGGKTLGLNAALKVARGEIVLFSDANILYEKNVLQMLVQNFADPTVGCVTGDSRYRTDRLTAAHTQENTYWNYERFIRTWESQIGSTVGGDGAIFAIRRKLFRDLASDAINDLVIPLQIVMAGYRSIFEPKAVGYESSAGTFRGEFKRKQRIVNRSWRGIMSVSGVLNPFRVGLFSWEVWSHKLLRWFVLPVWVVSGLICVFGSTQHPIFTLGAFGFFVSLILAGIGIVLSRPFGILAKISQAMTYFYVVNFAAFLGIIRAVSGKVEIIWKSERN